MAAKGSSDKKGETEVMGLQAAPKRRRTAATTAEGLTAVCDEEDLSSPHKTVLHAYRHMLVHLANMRSAPSSAAESASAPPVDESTFVSAGIASIVMIDAPAHRQPSLPLPFLIKRFRVVYERSGSKITIYLQVPKVTVVVHRSGHLSVSSTFPHQVLAACELVLNTLNTIVRKPIDDASVQPSPIYAFESRPRITIASRQYRLHSRINLSCLAKAHPDKFVYDLSTSPNASYMQGDKSIAEITSNGVVTTSVVEAEASAEIFRRVKSAAQPFKISTIH